MKFKTIMSALAGLYIGVSSSVALADVSIKAFAGFWEGNAISENSKSVNFQLTSRDLNVEIRPQANGAFNITWRTLQRQKGDPSAPQEVLKETSRTYMPDANGKFWKADGISDPYNGQSLSWASLKGQKLTVYSMAVNEVGGYDMLVYERTLTGLNMKLDFTAIRDGKVRRTASGTLIKSGK